MTYLLDTNILIRSKNEMPMDLYPTFWLRMTELANSGLLFSCRKVREEIEKGNDDLKDWCRKAVPRTFFINEDEDVTHFYGLLIQWAQNNLIFKESARQEFASVADAYLVATAAAKSMKVVTYETSDPSCSKRVKVPDACIAVGVDYCSLNDMLRELHVLI